MGSELNVTKRLKHKYFYTLFVKLLKSPGEKKLPITNFSQSQGDFIQLWNSLNSSTPFLGTVGPLNTYEQKYY